MSAKPKPKHRRIGVEDLEVLRAKPRTGGARITLLEGGPTPKAIDNGKISRRRNPAQPDLLKTLPEARQRVFERHYPELAKNEKTRSRKTHNK